MKQVAGETGSVWESWRVRQAEGETGACEVPTCSTDPLQVAGQLSLYLLLSPQLQELLSLLHSLSLLGKLPAHTRTHTRTPTHRQARTRTHTKHNTESVPARDCGASSRIPLPANYNY